MCQLFRPADRPPARQDPRPALLLLQQPGRFHLAHHHFACRRLGREEQQQHIRLPQLPIGPFSPGGAHRHRPIDEHLMAAAQMLVESQSQLLIQADVALVADEHPHGFDGCTTGIALVITTRQPLGVLAGEGIFSIAHKAGKGIFGSKSAVPSVSLHHLLQVVDISPCLGVGGSQL